MTTSEILIELESYSSESIKKIFLKHGAKEPFFGVKVENLKKIQKKVKKDYQIALELYDTGNSDAMYLAGLIADDRLMTKDDLNRWVQKAYWYMLSEFTVPWVAAGSNYGHELALEWMASNQENIAAAGWATYSNLLTIVPDEKLDKAEIKFLLFKVENEIHSAQNWVKRAMNSFVIAAGGSVPDLTELAIQIGKNIGIVTVNMGDTSCKTPYSPEYIEKIIKQGSLGKKKKTLKC